MKKRMIMLVMSMISLMTAATKEITLDYCLTKAEENYPLIKRYGLVEKTADLQLSDINKSWLPKISVYGQATAQNIVPEFPESLKDVLAQLGQDSKGTGHVQYKAGVDVSQTIWDGGASKSQREIARAAQAEQQAAIAVQIYAIRRKVQDLYFGILLIDEQIAQAESTIGVLQASHRLMASMLAGGVAMQSDVDMVEARLLEMSQQLESARSAEKAYRDVLAVYVGESLDGLTLTRPEAVMPPDLQSGRPELELFKAQTRLTDIRSSAVDNTLMPRVGFFARTWYGYPGINYFESMINRSLSFNIVAGVKISWNIDAYYTRKNSRRRLANEAESIENDREIFLYNTRLLTAAQTDEIEGLRRVMKDDSRIVELRANVRKAAESQLRNGVIDATALLAKIDDENQARLAASYHEIQLIQNIYNLKNALNR